MIVNGFALLGRQPIKDMLFHKTTAHGLSYGLSEVGYDFRIKQKVVFHPPQLSEFMRIIRNNDEWRYDSAKLERMVSGYVDVYGEDDTCQSYTGRTALGSSIEEFQIPGTLWCEFRNKSTHARRFLDASLGTDGEPGWNGFLTIELVFQGNDPYTLEAGSPILKAVFHEITEPRWYQGKYQNQLDRPIEAIL